MDQYDVVVVGAGLVGLATAREFADRRPGRRILVLEKEAVVAGHQSGHNSGVIHGGVYYQPGSLKARLCLEGAELMTQFCDEHAVPYRRCGKLIVATDETQLAGLDELERRGRVNNVPGLRRIEGHQIGEIEPNAVGVAAVHTPNTAVVDYVRVARALADDLIARGGEVRLGTAVQAVWHDGTDCRVRIPDGEINARLVVQCAGLWSDRLARRSGGTAEPRIVPFRGGYLQLRPERSDLVHGMVYPVPDPTLPFLGVHITRQVDGRIKLGPTAMLTAARDGYRIRRARARDLWEIATWPGTWALARRHWRTGLTELHLAASRRTFVGQTRRYVPALRLEDLDGSIHAGVRAQALGRDGTLLDDFLVTRDGPIVHVRNAPSPAATSSLALGRLIVSRCLDSSD